MLFYLFLLFAVVPIVELSLLIWLGGQTVWWLPVLLVIAGGIAGALLWRWQGLRTLVRIRAEVSAGRMPADEMVNGLLIFLAGGLLIAPGMISDVVGLSLLIPPIRNLVKRFAQIWFIRHGQVRAAAFDSGGSPASGTFSYSTFSRSSASNGEEIPFSDTIPASDRIIDARVIRTHVEDIQ